MQETILAFLVERILQLSHRISPNRTFDVTASLALHTHTPKTWPYAL
jgi:hypothetical protein